MEEKRKNNFGIKIKIYLSILILFIIFWSVYNFGILDIEQILFNLFVGVEGAGQHMFLYFIKDFIIIVVPCFIFVQFFEKIKEKPSLNFKIFNSNFDLFLPRIKKLKIYSWIGLLLTLGIASYYLKIPEYVKHNIQISTIYEDYYVSPDSVDLLFPEVKRNLIYIILESLETDYSNYKIDDNYVNLTPNLKSLAENNQYFSYKDSYGGALSAPLTTWTTASLVAQTAGVPLNIPIDVSVYGTSDSFLPYIITIGDILESQGYNQKFMIGSDADFGGRRSYFTTHGNYKIWDYYTAKEKERIPEDYFVWWGYEDSKLFEYAKEELLNISSKNEPFNFTMLTVNTHFFEGYTEDFCEEVFSDSYANSIYCSDRQLGEFINWIKSQEFYNNTTIVITGDHLTMNESFFENQDNEERTIYNAFINSSEVGSKTFNRQFSVIDMFPTTLASIGVDIEGNKLGLGTNLFSEESTLIERLGREYFEEEIYKRSKYYKTKFIYKPELILSHFMNKKK